jgi:hypothetical protein
LAVRLSRRFGANISCFIPALMQIKRNDWDLFTFNLEMIENEIEIGDLKMEVLEIWLRLTGVTT